MSVNKQPAYLPSSCFRVHEKKKKNRKERKRQRLYLVEFSSDEEEDDYETNNNSSDNNKFCCRLVPLPSLMTKSLPAPSTQTVRPPPQKKPKMMPVPIPIQIPQKEAQPRPQPQQQPRPQPQQRHTQPPPTDKVFESIYAAMKRLESRVARVAQAVEVAAGQVSAGIPALPSAMPSAPCLPLLHPKHLECVKICDFGNVDDGGSSPSSNVTVTLIACDVKNAHYRVQVPLGGNVAVHCMDVCHVDGLVPVNLLGGLVGTIKRPHVSMLTNSGNNMAAAEAATGVEEDASLVKWLSNCKIGKPVALPVSGCGRDRPSIFGMSSSVPSLETCPQAIGQAMYTTVVVNGHPGRVLRIVWPNETSHGLLNPHSLTWKRDVTWKRDIRNPEYTIRTTTFSNTVLGLPASSKTVVGVSSEDGFFHSTDNYEDTLTRYESATGSSGYARLAARFLLDLAFGQASNPICAPSQVEAKAADTELTSGNVMEYKKNNGLQLFSNMDQFTSSFAGKK